MAALRGSSFQGIAYARPVAWDATGDNTAAVIMLNVVDGDRFKEIGEVTRDELGASLRGGAGRSRPLPGECLTRA